MSKISSAFGGGGKAKKPSTAEIFFTLAALQKEKERAALLGIPGVAGETVDASLKKFEKGRRTKATRLKGGRVGGPDEEEQDNTIKRPGARRAKLLGQ